MGDICVSAATASLLGLKKWNIDVMPTTLYFMVGKKCNGACGYCTQGKGFLSRVRWPSFSFDEVLDGIDGIDKKVGRICIQSLYYSGVIDHIIEDAGRLGKYGIPISVSMNPTDRKNMERLKHAGVERVGIGLDCCTKELFNKWKKGVPSWEEYLRSLKIAKNVFGNSTAHLIMGLGESDEEAINIMQKLSKIGMKIALFAYTPIHTGFSPKIERYRSLQLARYMVEKGEGSFVFRNGKLHEMHASEDKNAFLTSGCPLCNRPFYNERVRGPIYNYPRELRDEEMKRAMEEVKKYVRIYTTAP
ncbi:MAG: radical SAM protein [Candidatus Thermoplasmatota archaeon]|nr:radical SAM protein [Candidatus Thermoplasmatota archaeon]